MREKSELHFTPVEVARRAAELLADGPNTRILDVGSAVGKFCIVGAVTVPEAHFIGVERRRHLVSVAARLARRLELANVTFACIDAIEIDWSHFDAFYLFNPFAEHLPNVPSLDETIELDPEYFLFYVRFVRQRLAEARIGTRVVAYHGFGGDPPPGYMLLADEPAGTDRLELWLKTRPTRGRRPSEPRDAGARS
jgi:hypothetical protein